MLTSTQIHLAKHCPEHHTSFSGLYHIDSPPISTEQMEYHLLTSWGLNAQHPAISVPPWTLVCRYSPPLTRNLWSFFQGKLYPSYLAIMICTSLSVFMLSCFSHTLSTRTNLLLTIYYMPDIGMHRYEIISVIFTLSLSWHNALAHQTIATMD